ncbi:MAG: type II toxin-antitoxin system VapC family toxin [Candidatus Bathyarchaeales archaeon]
MKENFMVETEFLFGFQPKDRRYDIVFRILKAYMETRGFSIYYPVSALMEVRMVMASHGKNAEERLKALTLIKAKAEASNLSEIGFSADNLMLCEEIMAQHSALTFFDALHASVALSNNLTIVSNDEAYDKAGVKRISFKDFLNLLEK